MRIQLKLGAVIATFALGFAPALAIAAHPNNGKHGSQSHSQANAKAFGKLCSTESKRHVAGQKGTPFSQCIAAMKKAASGKANSPGQACKGMSKKHVAGMKGTPFSQCVVAAAHLLGDKGGGTGTSTSTPAPTNTG
ncbi:MAG TPA: hypothetical protein VFI54_08325 [Solirubrobacteraceae bacterium]|nr:hypothetical protein [Solirubrobacteraceae bacterium]